MIPPPCRRAWLAVALTVVMACDRLPGPPRIDEVVPGAASEGDATVLSITGSFPPAIQVSYRDPGKSGLDTGYSVRLGAVELSDVRHLGEGSLTAVVPSDLSSGVYALVVTSALGYEAEWHRMFVVRPAIDRPTRLLVTTDPQAVPVGACSKKVTLETVNDDGQIRGVLASTTVQVQPEPLDAVELYADSECTHGIALLVLGPDEAHASLYFRPLATGALKLTFMAPGITSASQVQTVIPPPRGDVIEAP